MSSSDDQLNADIAALWLRWRPEMMRRVEVIESMVSALALGPLSEQQRQEGQLTAHNIAGTAGSFGFPEASRAARELELALRDGQATDDVSQLTELVEAIRADFTR